MSSTEFADAVAVLDRIDAAVTELHAQSFAGLDTGQRFTVLERLEVITRRLPVPGHELINQLGWEADPAELAGNLIHGLSDRLRISRADARRRIDEAADLGTRRSPTGAPLPPRLPATAAAQRSGRLGREHVAVIRRFDEHLPERVGAAARARAEAELAGAATRFRPELTARLADVLDHRLNPDGTYTDADRARRRGVELSRQGLDGMSKLTGWLTPEARATLEAVWAKLAAPGMANPEQEHPVIDGTPGPPDIAADTRSAAQRQHDALVAGLRALLASGELGRHNGLPATIIITTSLAELESAAGHARTGGNTRLPMSDTIRLARHAHHYLAVFDDAKPVALYHTRRLASPGQRIMLYARDRGCSHPGCTAPGYYCEVHHVVDYAANPETHMDNLTFVCGPHHRLVGPGGWQTRTRADGRTEWVPPARLERGQPRTNTFHHPEELPRDEDDDPG